MVRLSRRTVYVTAAALLAAGLVPAARAAAPQPANLTIQVVSGRADLITGGDALVRIDVPAGARASDVQVVLPWSSRTTSGRV